MWLSALLANPSAFTKHLGEEQLNGCVTLRVITEQSTVKASLFVKYMIHDVIFCFKHFHAGLLLFSMLNP